MNRWKRWRNESDVTLQSREGDGGSNGGNEKPSHALKTISEHLNKSLKVALLPLWFKDDLYIIRLRSYSTLNHLNGTRNEKVMSIENKWGRREKEKEKLVL
jgi:hypothetical protein